MKYALIVTLMIIAQACGRAPVIDPQLKAYVDKFQQLSGRTVWTDVQFVNEIKSPNQGTLHTLANCEPSSGKITIAYGEWARMNTLTREAVIMHEFGHCILGRGHDNSMNADRQPASYMHESVQPTVKYQQKNLAKYRDELIRNAAF